MMWNVNYAGPWLTNLPIHAVKRLVRRLEKKLQLHTGNKISGHVLSSSAVYQKVKVCLFFQWELTPRYSTVCLKLVLAAVQQHPLLWWVLSLVSSNWTESPI